MSIIEKIGNLFAGDPIKEYREKVEIINDKEKDVSDLSDEELLDLSKKYRKEISSGEKAEDDVMTDAFALVREVAKRSLGERHYDVQLIAGMVLHDGRVAEMLTGEGKTLASTSPIYLNALSGRGVHVITVNDYLAKRDAIWMGQVYHALGLSVSCLVHNNSFMYDPEFLSDDQGEELDKERDTVGSFKVVEDFLRPVSRKEAYQADIIYGTNHQFGFDYLRDNLTLRLSDKVQREPYFAIIDEVDSVLIDEARTPLIISSPDDESSDYYRQFSHIVRRLRTGEDYEVEEKDRAVNLTEAGIESVEKALGIDNIYSPENSKMVHYLNESLKAKELYLRDKDYVIKDGEIILVDAFTGRLMPGRRLSSGLHQAIEAKEGLDVQKENKTVAQITIQNYFRLYEKIAGMTGTAQTSAEEFGSVYELDVISIPTNRPVIRDDKKDLVYKTKEAKIRAVVEEVKEKHSKGQPILLGTTSISNNEELSLHLKKAGIEHELLNAKDNEREGEIIAQAGKIGAVTVATNMAGRGIDIVLGGNPSTKEEAQKVKEAGGLYVIGTERHESRRIDDQLRGRAGRQGDPGASRFFLSLEDDLMRIFGGEKIQRLMETLNVPEDMPIESGLVSKVVNQAQSKVEGMNLDMRKHLLDFDDVLNKQRAAIYEKREKLLKAGEDNVILNEVKKTINDFAEEFIESAENEIDHISRLEEGNINNNEEVQKRKKAIEGLRKKLDDLPDKIDTERSILLSQQVTRIIDMLWMENLSQLQDLRESVGIRAYGRKDPLVEYRREASELYNDLQRKFKAMTFNVSLKVLEMDNVSIERNLNKQDQMRQKAEHEHKSVFSGKRKHIKEDGEKVGRNDPCPCGKKKADGTPVKYKHCHGK